MENEGNNKSSRFLWLKRLGVAGFVFFLVKGLLWLSLPTLLIWSGVIMRA